MQIGPGQKPTKSVGSRETKLLSQWISLCLVTEFLLPTIGDVQMEMIRTILVLAIAFAARLAHAEGPEPITILDMPDLCGGGLTPCSGAPRTKTCCRTSAKPGHHPPLCARCHASRATPRRGVAFDPVRTSRRSRAIRAESRSSIALIAACRSEALT